jgi:hypothetical protein
MPIGWALVTCVLIVAVAVPATYTAANCPFAVPWMGAVVILATQGIIALAWNQREVSPPVAGTVIVLGLLSIAIVGGVAANGRRLASAPVRSSYVSEPNPTLPPPDPETLRIEALGRRALAEFQLLAFMQPDPVGLAGHVAPPLDAAALDACWIDREPRAILASEATITSDSGLPPGAHGFTFRVSTEGATTGSYAVIVDDAGSWTVTSAAGPPVRCHDVLPPYFSGWPDHVR